MPFKFSTRKITPRMQELLDLLNSNPAHFCARGGGEVLMAKNEAHPKHARIVRYFEASTKNGLVARGKLTAVLHESGFAGWGYVWRPLPQGMSVDLIALM